MLWYPTKVTLDCSLKSALSDAEIITSKVCLPLGSGLALSAQVPGTFPQAEAEAAYGRLWPTVKGGEFVGAVSGVDACVCPPMRSRAFSRNWHRYDLLVTMPFLDRKRHGSMPE